jgi:predicted XRE-type DNA-binding protein
MTNHLAIIGDIIQSKQVKDRGQLQKSLNHAFETIHEQFPNLVQSKFTLTLGDEFQALLTPSKQIFELLDHLEALIPVPFRFGLGYGSLTTDFDENVSIGADGPAYWHAREAIELIHDQNWSNKTKSYIITKDETFDRTMNNLILLSDTLKNEWTNLQKETFDHMLEQNIYTADFNQKQFADALGISPSSLSKRLNNGNIKMYLHTRNTMGYLLEGFDESSK